MIHTAGWPLDTTPTAARSSTTSTTTRSTLGFVVGLDYTNPYLSPFEEIPALEDAPARSRQDARRRQAPGLRRARDHRRRPAEPAEDGVPGRRAGRLRRRLPQREPHQGQPCGDQDRHARRRGRVRRRSSAGRQHDELAAYPAAFEKSWLHAELRQVAQLQAVVQEGPAGRHADDRHRAVAAAAARHQVAAVDAAPHRRPTTLYLQPGRRVQADRLSEARRQAHLRPPVAACSSATPTTTRTSRRT